MPRRTVLVPPERLHRWFENFETRHGATTLALDRNVLVAVAADGSSARARLPLRLGIADSGTTDVVGAFAAAALVEVRWGVLLVRKGGFAVAAGTARAPVLTKVGQRHVQGRTKAGGQSQQRFARRRENQARQAYEAAADHAHRILVSEFGGIEALVCGGDRSAVDAVLADPRLTALAAVRTEPWLAVPDPRRDVLDKAVLDAHAVRVDVDDPVAHR